MNAQDHHDDDAPVGRILSRREVLALLGGAGAAVFLAACGDTTNTAASLTTQPSTVAPTAPANTTAAAGATSAASTTTVATSVASTATASATTPAATTTAISAEGATVTAATTSATTAAAVAAGGCVVRPEVTEGPYFKDEKLNRSDVRTDTSTGTARTGVPVNLSFLVSQVGSSCAPLKGAQVDIWHCDAAGAYSDTTDPNWGSTVGQNFLRGYQLTDDKGVASFTTIFPGWYNGRTIHIHFKIRTTGANGQAYEFTSQLFFDETLSDKILAQAPYNAKQGTRTTRNANDNIYQSVGTQMILGLTQSSQGYAGSFAVGLDLSDTNVGKSDSASGGGPGGAPPGGGRPGGPPQPAPTK